jgi:hypothetical protein
MAPSLTVPSLAFNIHCSLAIPASIGSANFYAEEQKLKPKVTLALEEDDPILPPKEVAKYACVQFSVLLWLGSEGVFL